jgi:hypothetical protein
MQGMSMQSFSLAQSFYVGPIICPCMDWIIINIHSNPWVILRSWLSVHVGRQLTTLLLWVLRRYAWFAPHTKDFGWIGPTASLLLPDSDPPELSALGRVYEGYAQPEAVTNSTSASLMSALTQPLTVVDKAGSWLAACGGCVGAAGAAAVESVASEHCRDCGFVADRGVGAGMSVGQEYLRNYVSNLS